MEVNAHPDPHSNESRNRNLMIGIVIALLLCCCCAAAAVAGYYGYQLFVQAQRTMQELQEFQNFEIPEIPTMVPFDPANPDSTPFAPEFDFGGEELPEGGLTDANTRFTAWLSVQIIASVSGCASPTAQGTTISVTQQPDSNGVWVEEWNVNCGDGTSKPYNVTFTPQSGYVDVEVEFPLP
jgi:hypothetical protein